MIAVGIIEDEPIVRESLVTFFNDQHNLEVVCQVDSLESFEEVYQDGLNEAPDVLLLGSPSTIDHKFRPGRPF